VNRSGGARGRVCISRTLWELKAGVPIAGSGVHMVLEKR